MEILIYFTNKLWTFILSIHPLTYLITFIISGLLFYFTKKVIKKYKPHSTNTNIIATSLTIFVGLPTLGILLLFIIWLYLKDQAF
jgi:hypothetical protein